MARSTDELLRLPADLESDQIEGKESLRAGDAKDRIYQFAVTAAILGYVRPGSRPAHRSAGGTAG